MKYTLYPLFIILILATACDSDDSGPQVVVPETYEFIRDGQSSVSFGGQRTRQDMLSEMKSYLQSANQGEAVDANRLLNMYANENNPFSSADLNNADKQLQNKTFLADISFYQQLFTAAAEASQDVAAHGTIASEGTFGLLERGISGNTILVNEKGWEFVQLVEKGLMGSVFYHQIFNVYLSDERSGDGVENTTMVEGANYTPMEHHWDEAFGYWGVPQDFPNGDPVLPESLDRFWAAYTADRDVLLNINEPLMEAYKRGRAAIVAKTYNIKNEERANIIYLHELVAASTAIHYLNEARGNLAEEDTGNLMHHLSEAYSFVRALYFSPASRISADEIELILHTYLGDEGNFWTVTDEGLINAKASLLAAYPALSETADLL